MVKQRSFLRLRRRGDKIWFVAGLLSMSFSTSVFVYKWKFEPVPSVSAVPAVDTEEEKAGEWEGEGWGDEEETVKPLPEKLPPPPVAPAPTPKPVPVADAAPPEPKKPEPRPQAPEKPAKKPAPAKPAKPAPPPYEVFKARNPWQALFDGGGHMSVRFDDQDGQTVQLTYDFQDGKWVHAVQEVPADFSEYRRLKFSFRGEGDEGNNVELVVEDQDGTTRTISFSDQAHVDRWKAVDVPLTGLKSGRKGADGKMAWDHMARVILRISGHSWTKGTVWYKDVRFE